MRILFRALLGAGFGLVLFAAVAALGGDRANAQSHCHSCGAQTQTNTGNGCGSCSTQTGNGCNSCSTQTNNCNCTPPPPPSCNCTTEDHHHNNEQQINLSVVVNTSSATTATSTTTAGSTATASGQGYGTGNGFGTGVGLGFGAGAAYGGGGGGAGPGFTTGVVSMLPDVTVVTAPAREKRRIAYQASREKTVKVIIQAFCLDDRNQPHPASQLFPEKDVANDYEGELYRCIAGTRMQYVVADWNEKISFDGGKTITCDKDQALYHTRVGKLECRRQAPARDCNERSLLRRFGAGIKILTIITTETYTAYREEEVETSSVVTSQASGVVTGAY